MTKTMPSQEQLQAMFIYTPETGSLVWRWRDTLPRKANTRFAGKEAGYRNGDDGRRKVEIDGVAFYVHRVIWKLVRGAEPIEIDHANGDPSDNRLINLRPASHAENTRNRRSKRRTNIDLPKGVHRCGDKFQASIRVDGVAKHLGTFTSVADAKAAYDNAVDQHHGNFGRK